MKTRFLSLLISCAVLAGCSAYERDEENAYATELPDGSFEVEVRFRGRTYSSCNFSLFPSPYEGANWLYLKAITGTVEASDVIVTSEKAKLSGYSADRFKKGGVTFSGDIMNVTLELGQYRSVYGHNGRFHVVRVGPKKPNKAPEPTPVAVTPRATEGASK